MDVLKGLNEKQKEAVVQIQGPVLIFAGPGSGKTRVITHRIAYLICKKKISPYNILAVTFTNKAAEEMTKRVQELLARSNRSKRNRRAIRNERSDTSSESNTTSPDDHRGDTSITPAFMPLMGTFHSICARLLRREIGRLGYKSNFIIYDEKDKLNLIKRIMKENNVDSEQVNPQAVAVVISSAKTELVGPRKYKSLSGDIFTEKVAFIYHIYQKELKKINALDFDDLIFICVQLFQKYPKILQKYQKRFKYILVDEYQDTNYTQYLFAKLLARKYKNICVVGDDWQAIYGFRGADFRNILNFENDYPKARIVRLEQNYRSTKKILSAAQNIIDQNTQRSQKNLWTDNEEGEKIIIQKTENEIEEGRFVIDEIRRLLKEEKYRLSDFVILYRINAQSRALEEVLLQYDFPYRIIGGIKFYQRKEIKDVLAYLQVIFNPKDIVSLKRIINIPSRRIGERTFFALKDQARKLDVDLIQAAAGASSFDCFSKKYAQSLEEFASIIKKAQDVSKQLNVKDLIDYVLHQSGYKNFVCDGTEAGESRWENICELYSVAKEFSHLEPQESLQSFLEKVALFSESDEYSQDQENLTLMTLHNAKGLEFPVVFIVGMEEGILPHQRSLIEPAEVEEERRLCYVGITRAKERLYLVYTNSRTFYGSKQPNLPSQFLDDIPEHLIEYQNNSGGCNFGVKDSLDCLCSGDRIYHREFGEGVVVDVKKEKITVIFSEVGTKDIILDNNFLEKMG